MPAPTDQPRWPRLAPPDQQGHGQGGRWRSRGDATGWVEALMRRVVGMPGWMDRRAVSRLAGLRPTRMDVMGGGAIAETSRLHYAGGETAIHKRFAAVDDRKNRHRASAEYLASLVAQAVGASAPAVVKDPTDPDHSVIMGEVSGDLGEVHTGSADATQWGGALHYLANTDAGRRIGLLDVLIANTDRHSLNWILSDQIPEPAGDAWVDRQYRQPVAIDHSETFAQEVLAQQLGLRGREGGQTYTLPVDMGAYRGFFSAWLEPANWEPRPDIRLGMGDIVHEQGGTQPGLVQAANFTYRATNPLYVDDIPVLRAKLQALRPRFEEEQMLPAYEQMMARFEHLARRAGGERERPPRGRMFPDGG